MNALTGKVFIYAAPSGAGKTTIVRHLLNKYDSLDFSISATTREKRHYEEYGRDYFFMTEEEFRQRIDNHEFVEWEEVYPGQFYGTLKSEIDRIWSSGKHIVFDIDVRGAVNIKKYFGDKCMAVFVRPPSVEILIERLNNRLTETEESLKKRVSKVRREMEYENRFDVVLVNDLLELSLKEAEHIVETFLNGMPKND